MRDARLRARHSHNQIAPPDGCRRDSRVHTHYRSWCLNHAISLHACTYKECPRGCRASLNPGAGPAAAPSPLLHVEIFPPHCTLDSCLPHWAASTPPSGYFILVQDSQLMPRGHQPSEGYPPRDHFLLYSMFFDFCLFNCHTHVLVISPTHYYVISCNIISRAYYFIYYYVNQYSPIL